MNDMSIKPMSPLDTAQAKIDGLRHWKEKIEVALDHGANTHTFDDVCTMVMENRLALFLYPEAFSLMEIVHYPQFSVFHCFIAGGEMQAVLDIEKELMPVAKSLGCAYLSFSGREGWVRVHKANGWTPVCTTLYKEVL